jgi:simple sugar transport system permease protein
MAAAALAGGLAFLVAVELKMRLNVDEVVTTLLSNFIIALLVSLLIDGPLKDPLSMGWPQSVPVDDTLRLSALLPGSPLTTALLLALGLGAAIWIFNARTVWGFENKVLGANPGAARFAGMPVGAAVVRVALLSGGLAGLAGACEVLGPRGFVVTDLSPGFGYTGIVVATLAQLHPLGVLAAAAAVAAIYVGADAMSHATGVSNYLSEVIVSVTLLTMLVSQFFSRYRIRRG